MPCASPEVSHSERVLVPVVGWLESPGVYFMRAEMLYTAAAVARRLRCDRGSCELRSLSCLAVRWPGEHGRWRTERSILWIRAPYVFAGIGGNRFPGGEVWRLRTGSHLTNVDTLWCKIYVRNNYINS